MKINIMLFPVIFFYLLISLKNVNIVFADTCSGTATRDYIDYSCDWSTISNSYICTITTRTSSQACHFPVGETTCTSACYGCVAPDETCTPGLTGCTFGYDNPGGGGCGAAAIATDNGCSCSVSSPSTPPPTGTPPPPTGTPPPPTVTPPPVPEACTGTCVNVNSCQDADPPLDGWPGGASGLPGTAGDQNCCQQHGEAWDCTNWSCCGGACFLSGTKIATPGGETNIEDLKVGDKIVGFDPNTGSISASTVSQNYSRNVDEYYIIKTESGKEIKVTGEHPLYTGSEPQPSKTLTQKLQQLLYEIRTNIKYGWEELKKY